MQVTLVPTTAQQLIDDTDWYSLGHAYGDASDVPRLLAKLEGKLSRDRGVGEEYSQLSRLLDIQELLSDSGVGRQQHVIVSQGQIDAVLNKFLERGLPPRAGTLYPILHKLEKDGLVKGVWSPGERRTPDGTSDARRKRKSYSLTAKGRRRHGDQRRRLLRRWRHTHSERSRCERRRGRDVPLPLARGEGRRLG